MPCRHLQMEDHALLPSNERGGIEGDVTVARLDEDDFLLVCPATSQRRGYAWLQRNIDPDRRLVATDVTSAWAVIGLMGPRSRTLLQEVSGSDLGNSVCPFGQSVELELGYARVRAARVTYVGELGWELYIPAEFASHVFDILMIDAGFLEHGEFMIEIAGVRYPIDVSLKPFYDPGRRRVQS
ncbi:MAG: hypothetical protein U5R46_14630 [Gammaproteobacteria bacterium]|nr:hypothetical protein [Gammaproteobacteria bacterium]